MDNNSETNNDKIINIIGTGQRYQIKNAMRLPKIVVPLKPVMDMKEQDSPFLSKYNLLENQTELLKNVKHNSLPPIHSNFLDKQIKKKLSSYKQQDTLKKRYDIDNFVKMTNILHMMEESDLKCHYCLDKMFLLYEMAREKKQWTLDRIDNDIGHTSTNIVLACLECNLKRRRTRKEAYLFTKNLCLHKI